MELDDDGFIFETPKEKEAHYFIALAYDAASGRGSTLATSYISNLYGRTIGF